MKKLFILICTSIFVIFLTGCSESTDTGTQGTYAVTKATDSNTVKISGIIHNRDKYPNTKDIQIDIPDVSGTFSKIKTPIGEDNTFSFQFKLNQAQDMRMEPYLDLLYVYPDDSLHIEIDFNDLNKIELSGGKTATITRQLEQYFKSTAYRQSNYSLGSNIELNSSFEEIRKLLDDKKAFFYDRRNTFLQTAQVDDDVLFLTEAMIELDYYLALLRFVSLRDNYYNKIAAPAVLMDEINRKAITYFSTNLYSDSHFNFIGSYLSLQNLFTPRDKDSSVLSYLNELNLPNDTIKDFVFTHQASMALKCKDLDTFEELYLHVNHSYLSSRLIREYEVTFEKMNNPEAISASLTGNRPDMTEDKLSEPNLLSKIIAQNKGKVLIIDIWTTTCFPCIMEFPPYRLLIDEYKDKEVAFFFLCVGRDEQKSQALLKKYDLHHQPSYFCTEEEYRFLRKTFSPIKFPYGILVNKNGIIVDYGTYLRPAMIRKKLDTLLKQDKLVR